MPRGYSLEFCQGYQKEHSIWLPGCPVIPRLTSVQSWTNFLGTERRKSTFKLLRNKLRRFLFPEFNLVIPEVDYIDTSTSTEKPTIETSKSTTQSTTSSTTPVPETTPAHVTQTNLTQTPTLAQTAAVVASSLIYQRTGVYIPPPSSCPTSTWELVHQWCFYLFAMPAGIFYGCSALSALMYKLMDACCPDTCFRAKLWFKRGGRAFIGLADVFTACYIAIFKKKSSANPNHELEERRGYEDENLLFDQNAVTSSSSGSGYRNLA